MLASDFINGADGVRVTLIDAAKRTWSDAELLGYLNQALRQLCTVKPDAYVKRAYIPMVAGTNQQLPADGLLLMDLDNNEVSQQSVTMVVRSLLDHQNRYWQAATQELDVEHYAADPRDPRRFDVTPPNNGSGSVRATYGAIPAPILLTDVLPIPDSYDYPLRCFVLSRAYAKSGQRQDLGKVGGLMGEFRAALGLDAQVQTTVAPSPKRESGG
jgi:hypothetical protein